MDRENERIVRKVSKKINFVDIELNNQCKRIETKLDDNEFEGEKEWLMEDDEQLMKEFTETLNRYKENNGILWDNISENEEVPSLDKAVVYDDTAESEIKDKDLIVDENV